MNDATRPSTSFATVIELREEFARVAAAEPDVAAGRRWRTTAVAAAAVTVACAGAVVLIDSGDEGAPPQIADHADPPGVGPPPPSGGGTAKEANVFTSLAEAVAEADLIVVGTVVDVTTGRVYDVPPFDPYVTNDVQLEVAEVLGARAAPQAGDIVTIEEMGEGEEVASHEVPPVAPSSIGDSGIFFLGEAPTRPGTYYRLGTAGRFLETDDDGALESSNPRYRWAAVAAQQSLGELKAQIEHLVDRDASAR